MNKKCLYCYESLSESEIDYHDKCSRRMFGSAKPPVLEMTLADIEKYAKESLSKSLAVAGVQPKLSLEIHKKRNEPSRLTIMGLFNNYILKPPFEDYPEISELEDLTMRMAELAGITTAEHSLIKLASGELAYISKRFDRVKGNKLQVEDFAQLQELLTERKYKSSVEKIGKTIKKYSSYPGNDVIRLFEIVLFSYLTGNSDMHLKNYSLIRDENDDIQLSPAYDLLPAKLIMPQDKEESALTINGKKAKLIKNDFDILAKSLEINVKAKEGIYNRFKNTVDKWMYLIQISFVSDKMQDAFRKLIDSNTKNIFD